MTFIDANVLLRFLTGDAPESAERCRALFQRVEQGDEAVTTCEAVIAEVVYVLASAKLYGLPRAQILALLRPLLILRGFHLPQRSIVLRALDLFASQPRLDIADALLAAHAEARGATVTSFDRDLDRVPGIRRLEP